MISGLDRRVREIRARAAIRAWEYRQLRHASGTWFRFRRVLADAQSAWVITDQDASRLVAEGFAPEPVGDELTPSKRIIFVPEARLAELTERQAIPVRLSSSLLAARNLALVRFPEK